MKKEKNMKMHLSKKVRSAFKEIDIFGHSIDLTHNGEHEYKTTFGATVTMGLVFLIIGYMGNEIKSVLNRNPTISTTSFFKNLIHDHSPQIYNSSTFDFAMLVNSVSGN